MDDHSSDSICSDDTEYLLGQNVSIRELDDYEELPSRTVASKPKTGTYSTQAVHQYHEPERGNLKNRGAKKIGLQDNRKSTPKTPLSDHSKNANFRHQKKDQHSIKAIEVHDPHKVQHGVKQNTRGTPVDRKLNPQISHHIKSSSSVCHKEQEHTQISSNGIQKKRANLKNTFEERNIKEEGVHFAKKSNQSITRTETEFEKKRRWRDNMPSSNQDITWEWNQRNGRDAFESPEHADVVSVASEATEELLKDDELDGSIVRKLKELNLAVNFDPDTQELFDDKVREGAQLLSRLFGGSVDNYYSSPSAHSGSASGPEISRGESDADETRNISNTSSKGSMTSFSNVINLQHLHDEHKRRPKVSFATDESTSFDISPINNRNKLGEHFTKSPKQSDQKQFSHNIDSYSGFVRETSALRAAMDYGGDDDDEASSPDKYTASSPGQSRGYAERMYQQKANVLNQEDTYSTGKTTTRFSVERYSDGSRGKTKTGVTSSSIDIEPQWDGFLTSTPHKTTSSEDMSPGSQIDKNDIKTKLYLEKKLQEADNKLNRSVQELKVIQYDVEDALSKKKVALGDVQVLEDQLKRTKADIRTSVNLAEQYKLQVTKTRSELMDLEVERDSARHDIKDMENLLIKQKQEMSEAFKVERKNDRKVMELSLENSKLHRELETLKTKLSQSETTLVNEKKLYLEKIAMLQEELRDEQKTSKESLQRLHEQLEEERQSARSSHYERIHSIHKFQDEAKEMQTKEIEAVKTRLAREHEVQFEKLQEKTKREVDAISRNVQDGEFRISQLNCTLTARDEDIDMLKTKLLDEKQILCDSEVAYTEGLAKYETYAKALKAEVESLKNREASLTSSNRALEQSFDDKIHENRRLKDQLQNVAEESSKVEENKQEEIQMLRSLVRQQEEATRLLGEKMRNEAQEQIRTALLREREAVDKERQKQKEKLIEIKEGYDGILNQVQSELENERRNHQQLQTTALKLKKEVEELRERNIRTQEEKVAQIGQLRQESKEQIMRLRDKIQELSLLTDRNEKDFVLEINEECRRVASLIGGSPNTTPMKSSNLSSSFTGSMAGESPGSSTNSPAREALANLKSCNAELRQHLFEARKEIENQKNDCFRKQSDSSELTQQQISLFKKALKSKDDEVARLKRQLQEDSNRITLVYKSERNMMQKTIEHLEKELKETKKLIPASSPITNGHSFTDNTSTSGLGTSYSSITASPRPGEDSSSARLLRHLQGRVQQLRAQNDSLRSDSLNESHSSVGTIDSTFDRDGTDDPHSTKKLQSDLQMSDNRANKNAAMLSQKMLEMTKLQKMLTHATKENMKLERAYASLQKKMIDTSPMTS